MLFSSQERETLRNTRVANWELRDWRWEGGQLLADSEIQGRLEASRLGNSLGAS